MKFGVKVEKFSKLYFLMKLEIKCLQNGWLTRPLGSHHQHVRNEIGMFDKIGTQGKRSFKNKFLQMVFQFLEEIIIY